MHTNIFTWIRKRQFTLQLFVAVMVNMMVFSQPLSYALNKQHRINYNYFGSGNNSIINSNQADTSPNNLSQSNGAKTSDVKIATENNGVLWKDANTIPAIEKQGIIGKSENLPIDELTDNIFSFELKEDFKKDKEAYLEYELFGLADGSQATKSINDQLATGGSIIKTNKVWTKVKERLNPSDIQKGKNFVKFTTIENADYQYMVRNLKMVYEDKKNSNSEPIVFNQHEAYSYNGKIAFSGFITDQNISKVIVLGNEYPVINGVFEVLVEEKAPNSNLVVAYIDVKGVKKENTIKVKQLLEAPTALHKNNKVGSVANKVFEKGISNSLSFAGATIKVEDLTVNETATISIAGLRYVDLPTLSPEMVNVTADYYGYRMLPHGNLFNSQKPAKIHLKYDEKKLPTGYTAKDIKTFYFDNEQRKWLALEKDTLLSTTQEIVSRTTHFTDFINGIIKVPESPETGSYTPTSIKDIKAADPAAGVVSIAPPSPNNMGTLNTSFPIKLPAGRSGMQPELSVNYNSEGGNGWMGLGWDLSIPGVSLDTRWGAPRYGDIDGNGTFDNKETEIYSMGGGMLTLDSANPNGGTTTPNYTNPHRTDNISSNTTVNQRQFYPRIEGSYAKIIRHGNNPTNYWWEVTDKMGNKSFYGGHPSLTATNGVNNEAIIRTGNLTTGNIAYWGLYRTEDTNGNYVEYVYQNNYGIDVNSGQPGTGGNEFYIKEIRYTRHLSEGNNLPENYYKVTFNRVSGRADVQINARNGVVQVTKDLLDEIKVEMVRDGLPLPESIRSYKFTYNDGLFFKKLLKSISEYDANGDLFYSNTMEYDNKDEVGNIINESNFIDSTESALWNHQSDTLEGNLLLTGLSNEFSNKGSALGSTKGWGINGGLYVGFGFLCTGSNIFTAGVNGGYSYSESEGLSSFMDVNGDGLPDKIFKKDGVIKFRPNLGLSGFGDPKDVIGIGELSKTISDSKSVGVQSSFGLFAGYTYNTSKSITKTYFSDVNGDGLIDLIDNGKVQFNHTLGSSYLNSTNFLQNNSQTSNPVGSGAISTIITNNVTLETKDQLRDENPQHDIVKIWTAPKEGTISITGDLVKLDLISPTPPDTFPSNTDQYFGDYDGVRLSIQKNISTFPNNTGSTIIKEGTISPTFLGSATPNANQVNMNYASLSVAKGDRLYFRVQAKDEGTYDRVKWNPVITYTGLNETNVDGISYYSSSASEGFILSGLSTTVVPEGGPITITWPGLTNVPAYTFSDNIIFKIEQGTIDPTTGVFAIQNTYLKTLDQNSVDSVTPLNFSPSLPTNVPANTAFRFSVSANSNVNWKAINWQPTITNGTTVQHAVVDYGIFAKKINNVLPTVTGLNSSPIIIKPVFNATAFNGLAQGSYNFKVVVKNSNKRVIGVSTNDVVVIVNESGIASLSNTTDSSFYDFVITENITSTIYTEIYTNYEKAADVGAQASSPITVQIYQSNSPNVTQPSYSTPAGTCATNWITDISLGAFSSTGNTCPNYYQIISTPIRAFLKGSTYNLTIKLNQSSRAAVWIDWNRNPTNNPTSGTLNEFYFFNVNNTTHTLNITVPSGITVEGQIKVRVMGGLTTNYTTTSFTSTTPGTQGSVRDFWINTIFSLKGTLKDIYSKGNNEFGPNYRNWGHFAYHGGIVIKRGVDYNGNGSFDTEQEKRAVVLVNGNPVILENYGIDSSNAIIKIDETVLNTNNQPNYSTICVDGSGNTLTGQALIDCIQANNNQSITSVRFISLIPNEEYDIWYGSSKEVSIGENHFSTSRMGVKNIKTIYVELPTGGGTSASSCDFPAINGISLINKGEGDSVSIGGSVGGIGGSLNTSSSFNWTELNYMDLNGDRYPDILTKDNVQFTNSSGALSETKDLGFGRVSSGTTSSSGAGASGTFTISKTPGTNLTLNIPLLGGGILPVVIPITEPKVKSSAGINANVGGGGNEEHLFWTDMNGDGLPDRINVSQGIRVSLNLGYSLDTEKLWINGTNLLGGTQTNFSGGAGFSYGDNSYGGGISISASRAYTQSNLADINGDGLPDLILNNDSGNLSYRINNGNGFNQNTYNNSGYISFNRSTAEGLNASFSIPIPIGIPPFICFQIIINPSFGGEQNLNRAENSLEDINGDGFLDILTTGAGGNNTNDGELHARLSKIGTTNLLKKVNTPTGGSWEVAYQRVGNTFDLPQSKYVVSRIAVFDAFTADNNWSNDRNVTSIEYQKPYHDRREREFFGFGKVIVNQHGGFNTAFSNLTTATLPEIYRYSVQEFHNDNYYLKGAVKKESLFDANEALWTENITTYGIYKPETVLTVADTRPASFNDTNYATTINADIITYGTGVNHVTTNVNFICTDLDDSRLFVTPLVSVKSFTENETGLKTAVTIMESFDNVGNITQYRDYGEQNTDVYVSKIEYNPITINGQVYRGYPSKIQVLDNDGTTLKRERQALYNSNGDLEKVITKLNTSQNATVRMEYDTYGNLSKVTHENSIDALGNQFFREYTYDDLIHTYPVAVNDAFGYSSSSIYNYLFGIPVYTTDMNLQPMRTRIDDRGRPIEITGPYELFVEGITGGSDVGWTIRFEYQNETPVATKVNGTSTDDDNYTIIYDANNSFVPNTANQTNNLHHALTRHFDPEYRADEESVATTNQILTSTLVDGFGKPVQVKKMFARHLAATTGNTPNTANNAIEWLLAGKVKQDAFGRAIESYYPTTQTGNFADLNNTTAMNAFVYDNTADPVEPTKATYDVLDRSLTTKLPGETEQTTMVYAIDNNRFVTTVTNESGQVQKSYTDVRGRTTKTLQESVTGDIPTSFEYNNIGELLKVTDVANNITESKYDLAGRRTELRHPDNGITQFVYDQASNLRERKTANLLQAGQNIEYKYTYNRLDEINYPQNPENNVRYYYGTAGNSDAANDNAVGRLWYHVDATGTQYMKYGRLGELTLNRRSVAVPGDRVYWFQTEWTYDTWNRVKTIKYPDEELVTYKYNKGGELHAMTSQKKDANGLLAYNKDIISQLGYDKFGQRTYLRYGNGTETTYDYQAERRRLDRMKVQSTTNYGAANNRTFVNNKYNYDVLSNVLSIDNNTVPLPTATPPSAPANVQIGGRSIQTFAYDDLNRLLTATGSFVGRNDNGVGFNHSKYTLAMSYDSQHNITGKIQNHETAISASGTTVAGTWTQVEQTSYQLGYQDYNTANYTVAGYTYTQPHAPRKIIDQPNLAGCCDANDPRVKTKTFEYDRNGNQTRITSTTGGAAEVDVLRENLWDEENRLRAIDLNPEANTVHPIAIYSYDAGGKRIIKHNATSVAVYENALQVGTSIKNDFMLYPSGMLVFRPSSGGDGGGSYTKHYFAGTQRVSSKIGTTTNLGKFLEAWTFQENSNSSASTPINPVNVSTAQLAVAEAGVTKVYAQFGITPAPTFNSTTVLTIVTEFEGTTAENEQFWFHPDHLGSSNYITNIAGEVSQHMEYFAFGETFIEEHKNSHNSPYKFNGKELDEESGLYYYGARYYDSRISIWASTDPLSGYNPIFEDEHYIDGEHNGGVLNSFNHNTYGYCYQNPVRLVDPNGKQSDVVDPSDPAVSLSFMLGWIGDARAGVKNLTSRALGTKRRFTGDGYFSTIEIEKKNSQSIGWDIFDATIGIVAARYGISGGSLAIKTGAGTISQFRSVLSEFKLAGEGVFGQCKQFASSFKRAYGGIKQEINVGKDVNMSVLINGEEKQVTTNGLHQFVEKVIDNKNYIFDNLFPKGVLKSEYIKGLEGVNTKTGEIISGKKLFENAKKIK